MKTSFRKEKTGENQQVDSLDINIKSNNDSVSNPFKPDKIIASRLKGARLLLYGVAALSFIALISMAKFSTIDSTRLLIIGTIIVSILYIVGHFSEKESAAQSKHPILTEADLQVLIQKFEESNRRNHDMIKNITKVTKLLFLLDIGNSVFNRDNFYIVWLQLTTSARRSFDAISYMNVENWTKASELQLMVLSGLTGLNNTVRARRLFVVENDEEILKLNPIIEKHLLFGLYNVKYVYSSEIDVPIGINIVDGEFGVLYSYDEVRNLEGGRLLSDDEVNMHALKFDMLYARAHWFDIAKNYVKSDEALIA